MQEARKTVDQLQLESLETGSATAQAQKTWTRRISAPPLEAGRASARPWRLEGPWCCPWTGPEGRRPKLGHPLDWH